MKLKPMFDRVLARVITQTEMTESGIIMPATVQEKPMYAEIVAVGEGGLIDGNEVKMVVKVGQHIFFNKFSATVIQFEGKDYVMLKQIDILAVVED